MEKVTFFGQSSSILDVILFSVLFYIFPLVITGLFILVLKFFNKITLTWPLSYLLFIIIVPFGAWLLGDILSPQAKSLTNGIIVEPFTAGAVVSMISVLGLPKNFQKHFINNKTKILFLMSVLTFAIGVLTPGLPE